jgi:hypothetical protein
MLALAGCVKPAPSTDLVCVSDEGSNRVHVIDAARRCRLTGECSMMR